MTDFPAAAAFGKRISLAQLRKRGLPPRFAALVKSLAWAFKLAPDTILLPATESVREIEVMDLALRRKGEAPRALASLVSALDRLIPSPLVFRLFSEDGDALGFALNLKPSGGALRGESDLFRLFRTDVAEVPLPQGCASLETLLLRFAAAVAGMAPRSGEGLRGLDERHYRLEALRAELAEAERKLAREDHLDRKYALAKETQRIGKEIRQCLNSTM